MEQKNNIRIFDNGDQLTAATAEFIVSAAENAIEARGRFVISLSGGHTPEHLYTLLSKPPYRSQINWDKTVVFWGDERCVPSTDKDNNARMAKSLLLDNIEMPSSNIYPVPVDLEPADAADKYEQSIKDFFTGEAPIFDLILLGLGENGHTASLFPGTPVIAEKTRLVKEVYVDEQKMYRVTMTAGLINQARDIIFLLEGDGKAQVFKTILTAPYQPDTYPAQLIKPVDGNLYWFADKKAARLVAD
jgi:6-phosphogluconolactonase